MNYKGTRPKRFGNLITISNQELQDFIKNQTPIVKKGIDLKLSKRDLVDLVKFKQPVQRKGYNILMEVSVKESIRKIVRKAIDELIEDNTCIDCGHITNEDLRKWFGKGGAGGTTSGGWDRYGSDGQKLGKCGGGKTGGAYAACLSAEKARKLGPKGRAAFVRRKRAAQKKAGDTKKGRQRTKGKKPTYAKTGA